MTEFRGIIYKARNIVNGKIYIGYTTRKLEERRNQHIWESENSENIFHLALRKYSYHNFHWEILDMTSKNLEELKQQEIKYIKEFKSYFRFEKGYNMTRGGEGVSQKGDTKLTNPIVARQAERMTGRTKETHPGVAKTAEKKKGRTKKTCPGVARQSEKLKGRTKETHVGYARIAEKRKRMTKLTHPRLASTKKGKTKKNDPSISRMAEKLKGRTKETHPGVARQAEKLKGRTKETHIGLAIMAEKKKVLSKGQNNPNSKTNREKRRLAKLALENTLFNSPQ